MYRAEQPDIMRGALILLVVWGHLIEAGGYQNTVYFAVYLFHIPAFAMLSGMFSASVLRGPDLLKIAQRILVPFLIFHVLYALALTYFAPERFVGPFVPAWAIWFLLSLATWKAVLPIILKVPYPFVFSLGLALAAGYVPQIGLEFSLSRTLVFFPAFMFGHLYGKAAFLFVARHRTAFVFLFLVVMVGAMVASDAVATRWLWGTRGYAEIEKNMPGIAFRAGAIIAGIVATLGFVAVLPKQSRILARLGERSMPIYLMHGFAVIYFWTVGLDEVNSIVLVGATALIALGISVVIAGLSGVVRPLRTQLA